MFLELSLNWQPRQDTCFTDYDVSSGKYLPTLRSQKALQYFEMSAYIYQSKRCSILKDLKLQQHNCENRKHRSHDTAATSPAARQCMKPAHFHAGAVQELVDLHKLLHTSSLFSELSVGNVSNNRLLVGSCAFYHNFIWGCGGGGGSCNLPAVVSQKGQHENDCSNKCLHKNASCNLLGMYMYRKITTLHVRASSENIKRRHNLKTVNRFFENMLNFQYLGKTIKNQDCVNAKFNTF
jgi:hypothetical protein